MNLKFLLPEQEEETQLLIKRKNKKIIIQIFQLNLRYLKSIKIHINTNKKKMINIKKKIIIMKMRIIIII